MMKIIFFILLILGLNSVNAYPLAPGQHHIHYAFTMNFNPLGNVRYGIGDTEFGLIQSDNIGVMFLKRTQRAVFMQIGAGINNGGALIVGGGLEGDTSSWFRFRTDITVALDAYYHINTVVTAGGVFLL